MIIRSILFTSAILLAPIASMAGATLPVTNLTRCYCVIKIDPKVTTTCHPGHQTYPVYFGTLSDANQNFHLKSQALTEGSTAEAPLSTINGMPNSVASADNPAGGDVSWTNIYSLQYPTHGVAVEGKGVDMPFSMPIVMNAKWINPITCQYVGPEY